MRRLLLAGFLAVAVAGVAGAEDVRFTVFQGTIDAGKPAGQPVVIKVDGATGESWRLVVSNGYWWVPIKTGVIADKKAPAAEGEPAGEAPKP